MGEATERHDVARRTGRRALVADDDAANLRMLEKLLRSWGFEAIVAADGATALDVLRGPSPPDVAILDWMMPGMSGPEICRALDRPASGRTHLVLLTARGAKADLVEALAAGADDYVTKPFDFDVLRARVEAGARRAAAREDAPPVPATIETARFEARAGAVIEGRYRLESPIGSGGMGAVWKATHLALGRPVAVKLLREEAVALPHVRERFEREATILASITSPHVVRVIDYGVSPGQPYLVMEHLAGQTLESRVARLGPLTLEEARRLAEQLARGLDAVHDAGVLHRDVKPENVFLEETREGTVAKLIDFGISRTEARGPSLTAHGQILGTVGFMSPTQLMGEPATRVCDLWSLGATIVAALVGRSPFDAGLPSMTILATMQGPIPSPRSLRHDLPATLDIWAEVAFARPPELGFGSAGELSYAFESASYG